MIDDTLRRAVEELITRQTGRNATIRSSRSAGGGCINDARIIELEDKRTFFLKSNPAPLPRMFECECDGLEALAESGKIRVPRPIGTGGSMERDPHRVIPFIVMEAIDSSRPGPRFYEAFGRQFAALHRAAAAEQFGFGSDNYIGSTPQRNDWDSDWTQFWRFQRLQFQLDLARTKGVSDARLDRLGDRLLDRLESLIAEPEEPPALLHGDLWSGNYMCDAAGNPVLIDPAVYYGRREADLAMTRLFGGFDARFYSAYEEAWPLADGAEERMEIYKLYHLLNHLNLFGRSYLEGCVSIVQRFAG